MDIVKEVGQKIRALRESRHGPDSTQGVVAARAHISVSFLSMIERGDRSPALDTLVQIADALDVPLAELLSFDASPDRVDLLYAPLVAYCRKRKLTRKEMDKLLAVARSMFTS
jgi:transcriptional regulator with XRE-family HTH domain